MGHNRSHSRSVSINRGLPEKKVSKKKKRESKSQSFHERKDRSSKKKKRKHSESSSSSSTSLHRKRHRSPSKDKEKKKMKRKSRSSSSSSSSSSSQSSSSSESSNSDSKSMKKDKHKRKKDKEREEKKKKEKKKKQKRMKKKMTKLKKQMKKVIPTEMAPRKAEEAGSSLVMWQSDNSVELGPVMTDEQKARFMTRRPITKEEWDARQSIIRRVLDPETGRTRLVKGDGEILEEIVSKERHKEINTQATLYDGLSYQSRMGLNK